MKKEKHGYFMRVAEETSHLSTCIKKHVGAVLVKNGRILSTGYNGAPSKIPHCTKDTCLRTLNRDNQQPELCRGVHAEVNTIIQCAIHGLQIGENTTIYCTHFPCMACTKLIINSGIKQIIFENDYEMNNIEKFKLIKQSESTIYKFFWAADLDISIKHGLNKNIFMLRPFNINEHLENLINLIK